jgi:hypothetical protein
MVKAVNGITTNGAANGAAIRTDVREKKLNTFGTLDNRDLTGKTRVGDPSLPQFYFFLHLFQNPASCACVYSKVL